MNPYPSREVQLLNRLLKFLIVGLVLAVIVVFVITLHDRLSTSELDITAFSKSAGISITHNDKTAELIGTGTAHVRLTPGTYQLIAATNGERGYTLIHITKGKMSKITITQDTTPLLPSADDITFQNISSLRDNGLTNQQVNYVRLLFFAFNHNVQTVSIDTSTIRSIPYDPNSNNVTLGLNFNVVINNTPYTATVSYNDLTNIQLTLLDAQGSQVFSKDSTTITN